MWSADPCARLRTRPASQGTHAGGGRRASVSSPPTGRVSDAPDARPEAATAWLGAPTTRIRHLPAERVCAHSSTCCVETHRWLSPADQPNFIGETIPGARQSRIGSTAPPTTVTQLSSERSIDQLRQPVITRDRVVVEERDDVARGDPRARVARPGQSPRLLIRDDAAVRQRVAEEALERRVVVADDDRLPRRERLPCDRRDGFDHLLGPLLGVAADHDRHRRQRPVR